MKKLIVLLVLLGFLAGVAVAAIAPVAQFIHKDDGRTIYITQRLVLSANAAAVSLGDNLVGGYLFSVEILSSDDDTVTFSIDSGIGTELFSRTTTAATSGEIRNPPGYWPINSTPKYTLSGLGSGTVTIEITVAKR